MRFYLDEHIPPAVADGSRQRGINTRSAVEEDRLGAEDGNHLAFVHKNDRVLVSHDDDFLHLAADGRSHAGIVYLPRERSIEEMVRGLSRLARNLSSADMRNHVEFL